MPDAVRDEIEREGLVLTHLSAPVGPIEAAHVFVTARAALEDAVRRLLPLLAPAGFLWVSWPKQASKVPTDITEDVIRDVALPVGLVDVKVCADQCDLVRPQADDPQGPPLTRHPTRSS